MSYLLSCDFSCREAQKILEIKQRKITVAEQPLSLLRTTCVIWPNPASEVLLAGSFDGWTSQVKFAFGFQLSVCLVYEIQQYMMKSCSLSM